MITVSVALIAKDEEAVIRRCLSGVRCFADEIIVVDTGSKDRTAEISREMGAQLYDFPWQDDFAAARNFSFSKATMEYIFWLDADDVIDEENQNKLSELKAQLTSDVDVVMMRYEMAHASGEAPLVFERERLLRRDRHFHWQGRVHESIEISGKILHSDVTICHRKEVVNDPHRNLRIFETMQKQHETFTPRDVYYHARELFWHERYEEAIHRYKQFLNTDGWVEDQVQACYDLGVCYLKCQQRTQALHAYLHSFAYALPTSRICNAIGFWLIDEQRYAQAVYWYEQALRSHHRGGFENEDEHYFLPALQSAICYYYLNEHALARAWFARARQVHPTHPLILKNERFFQAEADSAQDE